MVHRRPGGSYELGLEFYRLAWRSTDRFSLNRAAAGSLQELAAACNETAFLGVYSDVRRQMMFATSIDSDHPLRYVLELWVAGCPCTPAPAGSPSSPSCPRGNDLRWPTLRTCRR